MNNSSRYIFVVNYERIDRKGNKVNHETVIQRGSINNQWFLSADYVIDTKNKTVLKNRKNILSSEQILAAYNNI